MAVVRVNPAEVGPRIAAAFETAASALTAPAVIPPPLPAGADPVSVAAANHVAVNAGQLSTQIAAGIPRLAEGGSAVQAALQRYVTADAQGAAAVGGSGSAPAEAIVAAIDIALPPAISIPDIPLDLPAAVASVVPVEPDMIDEALRSGAGESGLEIHATAWDAAAQEIRSAAQSLHLLAGSLPVSWEGSDATALSGRLQSFAQWMEGTATAAGAQANSARQVGSEWTTATNNHPRAQDYQRTRQQYFTALARASAGDPQAALDAGRLEAALTQMKVTSAQTMSIYGQGAGGTQEQRNQPGDSPRIANGEGSEKAGKQAASSEEMKHPGGQMDQQAGQMAQQMMQQMMQMPTQIGQMLGQSLGQMGQQVGQLGQQATQAVTQAASQFAGKGMPSAGGASLPRNPLSKLGSGGGAGGGAGGGIGGRTMPAGLPVQTAPPQTAPPAATTATSTAGARPSGPSMMGGGGMPMGMMPHGGKGGDGKEVERNKDWFPDESLVKDEVEVSEPIAGQRKRVRPTET